MIKIKTKKAAMFGLDARIALAIFGALSVISGAACHIFICISGEKFATNIETMLDGTENPVDADYLKGNVRKGAGCTFIKTEFAFDPANATLA